MIDAAAFYTAEAILRVRRGPAVHASAWRDQARPEQLPPDEWRVWYVRGGRGSGKTWTGANVLSEMALTTPGDYGVVAPTFADMRDKCIEGPSGLLRALGTSPAEVRRGGSRIVEMWNRSIGEMRLRNGTMIHGDGADDGAPTIQGFNLHGLWADEVGLWRRWHEAWEESIRYAVRLAPARIIATGTPKRGHPLVRSLINDPTVAKSHLRTRDNEANLDPTLLAELYAKFEGTVLGRQELEGELLDDVPGALWSRPMIGYGKPAVRMDIPTKELIPDMARIVVAIDPAVTSGEDSDETGIVGAGLGVDAKGYVMADATCHLPPAEWARRAINLYRELRADRIVAEANNGGDLVATVIHAVDSTVPVTLVHASRGKRTRAEPVSALYEQGRVFHVEPFPELEDQMCSYTGAPGEDSPDRMDALVWALTEVMGISTEATWGDGGVWGGSIAAGTA
jgi:predicted phage terminase large subunit-like protein